MNKRRNIVPEILAVIFATLLCAALFFVGVAVGASAENAEHAEFVSSLRPLVPGCLI